MISAHDAKRLSKNSLLNCASNSWVFQDMKNQTLRKVSYKSTIALPLFFPLILITALKTFSECPNTFCPQSRMPAVFTELNICCHWYGAYYSTQYLGTDGGEELMEVTLKFHLYTAKK